MGTISKESHGQGFLWGCALGLTVKWNCLKLQLLCVAFPEVFSSLPKLAHVQHRHLARLEEDLPTAKEE